MTLAQAEVHSEVPSGVAVRTTAASTRLRTAAGPLWGRSTRTYTRRVQLSVTALRWCMRTCSTVRVNLRGHQACAVLVVSEAAGVAPADGATIRIGKLVRVQAGLELEHSGCLYQMDGLLTPVVVGSLSTTTRPRVTASGIGQLNNCHLAGTQRYPSLLVRFTTTT